MSSAPIVSKVWSFCNTLRDDGLATAITWSSSPTYLPQNGG